MLKVYFTPLCPECAKLKRFLSEKGVDFEEINVLENKEAADFIAAKTGMRKVPVLETDEKLIIGFNREYIENAIKNITIKNI